MIESTLKPVPLVAPCGINCGICLGYLRIKNKCYGCWGPNDQKPQSCRVCIIKNCEFLAQTSSKFCYECPNYPCPRVKQLDKRYRTRYKMSNIENLHLIKNLGLPVFLNLEKEKWGCPNCGGTICVHRRFCLECNYTLPD